jgi:hypothetical protein
MFLLDVKVPFCLLGGVPRYCSLLRGVYAVCDGLRFLTPLVPHRNSGVFGWQCLLIGGYGLQPQHIKFTLYFLVWAT